MLIVVAVKYGVPPGSVNLSAELAAIPGLTIHGAHAHRAQVEVRSDLALARLRSALGDRCHIEEITPRRPVGKSG